MILLVGQILLKYGPATARAIKLLFEKGAPSFSEWEAVFSLAEKSYEEYTKPPVP